MTPTEKEIEKGLQELPLHQLSERLDQRIRARLVYTPSHEFTKIQLRWAAAAAILLIGLNLGMMKKANFSGSTNDNSYSQSLGFETSSFIYFQP